MLVRLSVLGACLLACSDARTEVVVRITADPTSRPSVTSLRVRVFDSSDALVYDETRPSPGGVLVLPAGPTLRPESGGEARGFRVEAELADGATTHTLRARSTYVAGQARELWLCLDEACRTTSCGPLERCVAGRCTGIDVVTTAPGQIDAVSACGAPPDAGVGDARDGGVDAGCGCACASDACDGACTPAATVRHVSAGYDHVCAIVDRASGERGELWCWGANAFGQLGTGDTDFRRAPVLVSDATHFPSPATDVSGGEEHTCATDEDLGLWCWGHGGFGRLGSDVGGASQLRPVRNADRSEWISVDAGGEHTCARASGDRLFCFGKNATGQLGDGGFYEQNPVPTQLGMDWRAVSLGDNHTCGLPQGSVAPHCWGDNRLEQLAIYREPETPRTDELALPNEVPIGPFGSISSGHSHVCGILASDERFLYCWGDGAKGQLGDQYEWPGGSLYVLRVLLEDETKEAPVRWRAVGAGRDHTCGILDDGSLFCWGGVDMDGGASLGAGEALADPRLRAGRVATGESDWRAVTAGVDVSCAIDGGGRLFCWGTNTSGQLGVGDLAPRFAPSRVCFP